MYYRRNINLDVLYRYQYLARILAALSEHREILDVREGWK